MQRGSHVPEEEERIAVGIIGAARVDLAFEFGKERAGERLQEQLVRSAARRQVRLSSSPATSRSRRMSSCS